MKIYTPIGYVDARTLRVLCGDLLKEERIIVGLLFVLCFLCVLCFVLCVCVCACKRVCVGGVCAFFCVYKRTFTFTLF